VKGRIQAASLMEPWISAAEKLGCKVICEAFYNGLEVADTSVDADIFVNRAATRSPLVPDNGHSAEQADPIKNKPRRSGVHKKCN
jgi:hypothetical protein